MWLCVHVLACAYVWDLHVWLCVCARPCMCMLLWVLISVVVFSCAWDYMYVNVWDSICDCVHLSRHVILYTCVNMCNMGSDYVNLYVIIWLCECVWLCVWEIVFISMCMWDHVWLCTCAQVCEVALVCDYVHVWLHVILSVWLYVFLYRHTHVFGLSA